MRKIAYCCLMATVVGCTLAQPVQAQDRGGFGAFLDWINKLSGPRMVGPALSGFVSLDDKRDLRVSVARRWAVDADDSISPTGSSLSMWSIQPTFEADLVDPLAVGVGLAIHWFGGDADSFTHWSVPLYAQLRSPDRGGVRAVASVGGQYFPSFDPADFLPLDVEVSTSGSELTFWFSAGLEIVFR